MLIKVTNLDTGQHIKTIDYNELIDICAGDIEMTNDFIRLIRKHPDNQRIRERWEIVEE